jgi:hypothetical protein
LHIVLQATMHRLQLFCSSDRSWVFGKY